MTLSLAVNGIERELPLHPERSLLVALREELGLTGAKYGCGEGACGACTVLVDGLPQRACVFDLRSAASRRVTTIEGLARDGLLHPLQLAFIELGAMQCGYCVPGMILSAAALLNANPDPGDGDVASALEGNICRCGAYPAIRRAVARAAELARRPNKGFADPSPRSTPPPLSIESSGGPWDLLPRNRRDYFGVLGDGLVAIVPPRQEGWWTSGGAWVHVGLEFVTAFSGKVDVGQDNRSALTLLVAEELRVEPSRVRLVMGDTDVCPFDMGTFASRSVADATTSVRGAAVRAREWLLTQAALRWRVRAIGLQIGDGSVRTRDARRSITYAELLRGVRKMVSLTRRLSLAPRPGWFPLTGAGRWQIAGRSSGRREALEIVTGDQKYPSDLTRPDLLHARLLHPPSAGASLRSVDAARARAIRGVIVVEEEGRVAVLAPDVPSVDRALDAIEARWAPSPQSSETYLEPHLRSHPIGAQGWEEASTEASGDVERALRDATVRLESTYRTAYIAHAPLEARVALAEWSGDRLTVWTGTQRPFPLRKSLAAALQVPEERVRVVVPLTGGAFGGKHTVELAIDAARLSRTVGRPVKIRFRREEEFSHAYLRPAAIVDVRSGAGSDGRITAWDLTDLNAGEAAIEGPYQIRNQRITFQPAASPLAQGSYRALAATANNFARESHLDELAHRLDQDPLDLRLAHLEDERVAEVLKAVADRLDWGHRPRGSGRGMGIACGLEKEGRVATGVEVRAQLGRPLEVLRIVTAYDCGAVVDPENLRGQVEGAMVMGLGGALFEAIHFQDGRILNPSFSRYRVPRIGDVPPIEVILVDRPDVQPAGAGETPMIALAPALANAIFEATGQRLRGLPLG